jgi:hypothetical protein
MPTNARPSWQARLARVASLPAATKTEVDWPPPAVLVLGTCLGVPNTLWWGLAYLALGKPDGGLAVLGYSLASVLNLPAGAVVE